MTTASVKSPVDPRNPSPSPTAINEAMTALEVAKALQNPEPRACVACGTLTTGSVGAAGYRWPNVCQPCKDAADKTALRLAANTGALCKRAMAHLAPQTPEPVVHRGMPAGDFAGISVPADARNRMPAPAAAAPTIATPKHLCPKCGEETPMDFIADRRICPDCGLDGELPEHPCCECGHGMTFEPRQTTDGANGIGTAELSPAGWACECGHFEAGEGNQKPRVSSGRP